MTEPTVTRTVEVKATPETVYALITDLETLAEFADETTTMTWKTGSAVATGAVFIGRNRNGRRSWSTKCTVTDATPGMIFAFEVATPFPPAPVARWQYDIEAAPGGCRVTESTWDKRPGWFMKPAELVTGVRDRKSASADHIEATLQRLKQHAESA